MTPQESAISKLDQSSRIDAMNQRAWELVNSDPDQALTIAATTYDMATAIGHRKGIGAALCVLGYGNAALCSRYDVAEQQLDEGLAIARTIADRHGEVRAINLLGALYRRMGDSNKAITAHSTALEIARELAEPLEESEALNGLGHAFRMVGQTSRSLDYHQESLGVARAAGITSKEAAALNGLGNTHEKLGDFTGALEYYIEGLCIAEKNRQRQLAAYISGNLAIAYQRLGDSHKALRYEMESMQRKQELGDRWGEGVSWNNLGIIYKNLGDYANALESYMKSLQITEEIGDLLGQSVSLNNIGQIYEMLGDPANVIDYYIRSLRIAEQIDYKQGEAFSLAHIGRYHEGQQDYPKALIYQFKSLRLHQETSDRYGERDALNSIGQIYRSVDDMETASEYFEKSLAIAEEIGDRGGAAEVLLNLAMVRHHHGRHHEAAELLHNALKVSEEIGQKNTAEQALRQLADLYKTLGDRQTSSTFERMSQEVNRQIFNSDMKERVYKLNGDLDRRNASREARLLGLPQEEIVEMNRTILKMSRMKTEQMLERVTGSIRPHEETESPAGPVIMVRTFGEFSVSINGRELRKGDWQRKRARDLFKLLLLNHATAVTIDEIVEMLWGGVSKRNTELLVMNAISHIRKAIDPRREPHKPSALLTSSDRTYTLDLGDGASVDFIRFRRLIAEARRSLLPQQKRTLYLQATDLCQGEFLKEDIYESWTAETRDRIHDMISEALAYLANEHLRACELDQAIATAKNLIERDPISESGYEVLLTALRDKGGMAELLKTFNECERAFRAELGITPPERLRRLIQTHL